MAIFEIIVIFLLLIIILIITPVEIQLYLTLGLCVVTLIVLGGFVIIQFINDPMGFVYSLIFNNPVSVLSNEMLNESIGFYGGVK